MDKDGDKNVERPKRPILRPKKLDNKRAVNPPVVYNSPSSGNSIDYENKDWWLQDLGVGTAEGDEESARNMEEWNPARSNKHGVQNRKRGANFMDSDSLWSNLDDEGSEGNSHCEGKKNVKRSRKSGSGKKSSEKKEGGKKESGKKSVDAVAKKKDKKEDDSEEQEGFNFFMKLLRAELIAKRVAMSAQQIEQIGRDIWRKMTSAEKETFIRAAALSKEKESKKCEKEKKSQRKEESDSRDDRNRPKTGRGKSALKNKD